MGLQTRAGYACGRLVPAKQALSAGRASPKTFVLPPHEPRSICLICRLHVFYASTTHPSISVPSVPLTICPHYSHPSFALSISVSLPSQVGGGGGDPESAHMTEEEREAIRKQLEDEMQVRLPQARCHPVIPVITGLLSGLHAAATVYLVAPLWHDGGARRPRCLRTNGCSTR